MPLYDCGAPDCDECQREFGPDRSKAVAAYRERIRTSFINPPIPLRQFDWQATMDGYDGGDPIGHGATEAEAIADLRAEMEFRA